MARKKRAARFFEVTGPRGGRRVVGTFASRKRIVASKKRHEKAGYSIRILSKKKAERLAIISTRRGGRSAQTETGRIYYIPRRSPLRGGSIGPAKVVAGRRFRKGR